MMIHHITAITAADNGVTVLLACSCGYLAATRPARAVTVWGEHVEAASPK